MRQLTGWLAPFLLINFLVMLPLYVLSPQGTDFFPFFPAEHPFGAWDFSLVSLKEYVKALFLRRQNPDIFRFSTEVTACFLLLHLLPLRMSEPARARMASLPLLIFMVLLLYHYLVLFFFARESLFVEDLYLLGSVASYAENGHGISREALCLLLAGAMALLWLFLQRLMLIHLRSRQQAHKATTVFLSVLLLYGASCHIWFGTVRTDPVMLLRSSSLSGNVSRTISFLNGRDRSEPQLLRQELFEHYGAEIPEPVPSVYVFLLESYGRVLAEADVFRESYARLLGEQERKLEESGFKSASGLSISPVFGGRSWYASATLLSGVRLRYKTEYDRYLRYLDVAPHLVGFFKNKSYHTFVVSAGNSDRTLPSDYFGFDTQLNRWDFGYDGYPYGWGVVPDQFALEYAYAKVRKIQGPVFMFFKGVSTHAPWKDVPGLVDDVRRLRKKEPTGFRFHKKEQGYLASVRYVWKMLGQFIAREKPGNSIYVITGDHQPPFLTSVDRSQFSVPLHVISADPVHTEVAQSLGLGDGLHPGNATRKLTHEKFFELVARVVTKKKVPEPTRPAKVWAERDRGAISNK